MSYPRDLRTLAAYISDHGINVSYHPRGLCPTITVDQGVERWSIIASPFSDEMGDRVRYYVGHWIHGEGDPTYGAMSYSGQSVLEMIRHLWAGWDWNDETAHYMGF